MSCSIDNLLNFFDFSGKNSMKEEDSLEGSYCSEQPLLDCGYMNDPTDSLFWALTSINTIEICDLENANL